ncbi:MAG: hypothetical protein KKD18_05805, partial [Nanoarchaeota archaeon]|nr:hypothetical protein [Nanoarchaeota archaeon]
MTTSSEYFKKMHETCAVVNPMIMAAVEPLKRESEGLYEAVSELPRKRTEASGQLRAFMLRNAYECAGGEDWQRIAPVCAAVELELCSMYYENRVYDEKGGKRDLAQISKSIMAAKLTRDLAERLVKQSGEITARDRSKIVELLNQADITFETGEYLDVFENTFARMGGASFSDMISCCERRIYGINAAYFERICEIGGLLAGAPKEETGALENFGRQLGMG